MRHRPRQVDERARGLGRLLGGVLALEPIEIERRQVRRELRVRRDRAEHVLEDRDRRSHVAMRPRAGRPVVAALADAAERQLRAREVRRAVAVEHAGLRARVELLEPLAATPVNTALTNPYGLASITAIASSSLSITSTHRSGPNTSRSV